MRLRRGFGIIYPAYQGSARIVLAEYCWEIGPQIRPAVDRSEH